jgi:hypothetical protein
MDQDVFGIMPNYFATTIADFSTELNDYEDWDQYYLGTPFTSELNLSE